MAPVCSHCEALFAGGDGHTCPACGAELQDARPSRDPISQARAHGSDAARRAPQGGFEARWIGLMAAAAVLVPVSSFLGVRGWAWGWLWIWQPSILADIVFTLGTMGAFVGSVAAARQVQPRLPAAVASMGAGFFLHWIVYEVSWSLVLAASGELEGLAGMGFVVWVGGAGLFASALAGGVATYVLRQGEPDPGPAQAVPTR